MYRKLLEQPMKFKFTSTRQPWQNSSVKHSSNCSYKGLSIFEATMTWIHQQLEGHITSVANAMTSPFIQGHRIWMEQYQVVGKIHKFVPLLIDLIITREIKAPLINVDEGHRVPGRGGCCTAGCSTGQQFPFIRYLSECLNCWLLNQNCCLLDILSKWVFAAHTSFMQMWSYCLLEFL